MDKFPGSGMMGRAVILGRRIRSMEIPTHASHACYFIVLALFPALVLMLGMLRYTSLEAADLMDMVSGMLPNALEPYIWRLISGTYEHTSRLMISLSALTALWSAGRGIHGFMTGLNAVYGVHEQRSWLHTRLMSMFYTVLFLLILLLSLVLHVFGNTIGELIHSTGDTRFSLWIDVIDWGEFVLIGAEVLVFCAMFMFLPCRRNGFRESLPGALFAALGWMTFSAAFSYYMENFPVYTVIFGSVYAVALGMLWLYMCVSIVFYGAVLNRLLSGFRKKS